MLPGCLSWRARPAQPEGGREALVAGSCPALPWGLGSWKGCWEEPWAPSHRSPRSWLWRECLTPRGQPGQPMALPRPELPWVFVWDRVRARVWSSVAGTLHSSLSAVLAPGKEGGSEAVARETIALLASFLKPLGSGSVKGPLHCAHLSPGPTLVAQYHSCLIPAHTSLSSDLRALPLASSFLPSGLRLGLTAGPGLYWGRGCTWGGLLRHPLLSCSLAHSQLIPSSVCPCLLPVKPGAVPASVLWGGDPLEADLFF